MFIDLERSKQDIKLFLKNTAIHGLGFLQAQLTICTSNSIMMIPSLTSK